MSRNCNPIQTATLLGMRIIAGKYRRRQLRSLEGKQTRPMLDRVRETLFNILQTQIEGAVFVDLYAGTGAVGIEALSRGAKQAVLVEANRAAARVIEENLRTLGAERDALLIQATVAQALGRIEQADIWFLGPPYDATGEYLSTLASLASKGVGLAIAQHGARLELPPQIGSLERVRVVKMGSNAISFYRPAERGEQAPDAPTGGDAAVDTFSV